MYVNTNQSYHSSATPVYYTKEAFNRCSTLNATSMKGGRRITGPTLHQESHQGLQNPILLASWPRAIS